jgi:hypothetical protein
MSELFDSVNAGAVNQSIMEGMNDKNLDLLSMSLEMSGKTAVVDGEDNLHALGTKDDLDAANATAVGAEQIAALANLLGVDPDDVTSHSFTATEAILCVDTTGDTVGDTILAVEFDAAGEVSGMASEVGVNVAAFSGTYEAVAEGDFLSRWGIDSQDFGPGDLFFIQQNVQIIKDMISTLQTSGKAHSDIMREATQKYAQG